MIRTASVLALIAVSALALPLPPPLIREPASGLDSANLTNGDVVTFMPEWMSHFPATSFWPQGSAEAVANDRDAEDLVRRFSAAYRDITISILWNRREVNAQARFVGGRRYVELFAGLVRHRLITWTGIAVVLAHEVGHHHAGPPRYPMSWASCEGQSDYWGTLKSMRDVFSGDHHAATTKAADELYAIFSGGFVGVKPIHRGDSAELQCRHPAAACRRQTYLAGRDQQPKPACAI